MKIIVFSDSHGKTAKMHDIIQREEPDMIIHLGDCYDDMLELKDCYDIPIEGVIGNVDYYSDGPVFKKLEINNKSIYLTHGHKFKVKGGLEFLKASTSDYDLVMFGHTHFPYLEEGNTIFFNPGSITRPNVENPSYGRVLVKNTIICELVYEK